MIFKAGELYQVIWKAIIRPPRDIYEKSELGADLFTYKGRFFKRRDFELTNKRHLRLKCSHFEPLNSRKEHLTTPYPCVVYLHGNCSSRLEALNCGCLKALLPLGISVLCFDFCGSGHSDGDYVSLGWYEKEDLECVIEYLRKLERISSIGLWGRSMGAVTACMFADSDPTIAGMVIDSPFSSLRRLAEELVHDFVGWKIPKLILSPALTMVKNSVQARAKFDIDAIKPIENCKRSFVPALFIAASDDTFIRPQHCKDMHEAYIGDKNLIIVSGTHNSRRPSFLLDSIAIFFKFALQISPKNDSRDIWENVAFSLALNERCRRQQILDSEKSFESKTKGNPIEKKSWKNAEKNTQSPVEIESTVACPLLASCSSSSDESMDPASRNHLAFLDEEDEVSLTSAVAQMMIMESIQNRNVIQLKYVETTQNDESSESRFPNSCNSSPHPIVNMPAAPHRVKDSPTKPVKIHF